MNMCASTFMEPRSEPSRGPEHAERQVGVGATVDGNGTRRGFGGLVVESADVTPPTLKLHLFLTPP